MTANIELIDGTVGTCVNTTVKTTVATFVLPPNTWQDLRTLAACIRVLIQQATGSTKNFNSEIELTDGTNTFVFAPATQAIASNPTITGKYRQGFTMDRVGSDIWLSANIDSGIASATRITQQTGNQDIFAGSSGEVFSGVDFASQITITVSAKWNVASTSASFQVASGYITLLQ